MHVLRHVRGWRLAQRLSQLWRWLCCQTHPAVDQLERRQLPWQGSGKHQGQAQAGELGRPRAILSGDQRDSAGATVTRHVSDHGLVFLSRLNPVQLADHLEIKEGICEFRPSGKGTLVEAVTLITSAFAYCR